MVFRESARTKLANLSVKRRRLMSNTISQRLNEMLLSLMAQKKGGTNSNRMRVGVFIALPSEPIIAFDDLQAGPTGTIAFGLPGGDQRAPYFQEWNMGPASLQRTPWGTFSAQQDSPRMSLEHLDLVVVPGRAFTPLGQRLGRGLGYYDRLIRDYRQKCSLPKVIGVAYSCQMVDVLPCSDYDEEVDWVLHEKC